MTHDETAPHSLNHLLTLLELAAHQVQAFDPDYVSFDAQRPLLVLPAQFETARPELRRRYPPTRTARVVLDDHSEETTVAALPLEASAWLLPALAPEEDRRSLSGLRGVMELLFGPDGCPWDREQTHETLRRYLLEEVYELVDAIDRSDTAGLREEVGDVLAHMFMQTALAQEAGTFTLEDAVEYAHDKFVRRHPHVFGEEQADSGAWVAERWDALKRAERAARGNEEQPEGALDSVPLAAPSLQRAQALIGRAQRAGLTDPTSTATEALDQALRGKDLGALLFAAVRLARELDVDAEEALREASSRFAAAFGALEESARDAGIEPGALPAEESARVWKAIGGTGDQAPASAP